MDEGVSKESNINYKQILHKSSMPLGQMGEGKIEQLSLGQSSKEKQIENEKNKNKKRKRAKRKGMPKCTWRKKGQKKILKR